MVMPAGDQQQSRGDGSQELRATGLVPRGRPAWRTPESRPDDLKENIAGEAGLTIGVIPA